ncbi:CpsD/CapB family tyrosine-protein kinase [Rummeliibacillus sp. JY-2-4R]
MRKKKKLKLQQAARKLIVRKNPQSYISEQFRTLRTNIKFSKPADELQTILVTSSFANEGKSTISANLACLFAEEGKKVLFIDSDMRKPTVQYTFNLTNTTGISSVLSKQSKLNEVIRRSGIPNLDIITSGPIPPNPSELLGGKMLSEIINYSKEKYNIIIFDAPPILAVADAQILANAVDGSILVINSQETDRKAAEKAVEVLKSSNAQILGTVLNNVKVERSSYYYNSYYSYS